jgi:hypothetical protein
MVNACAVLLLLLGTVFFNPLGQRAQAYATNLFSPPAISVVKTTGDSSAVATISHTASAEPLHAARGARP